MKDKRTYADRKEYLRAYNREYMRKWRAKNPQKSARIAWRQKCKAAGVSLKQTR